MGEVDAMSSKEGALANGTRLSERRLQANLDSEAASLTQDAKLLNAYGTKTAVALLHILASAATGAFKQFDFAETGHRTVEAQAHGFERMIDAMLASPALQALLKIQAADELGVSTAAKNEKLAFWMDHFQKEAAGWRVGVDDVVGEAKQLLAKQDAEAKATAAEAARTAEKRALQIEAKVSQELGALGGVDLGQFQQDLVQGAGTAMDMQNQSAKADRQYLNTLSQHFANSSAKAEIDLDELAQSGVRNATGDVDSGAGVSAGIKAKLDEQEAHREQLLSG